MKRGVKIGICFSLFLILSLSIVSAGPWEDFWSKITGNVVSDLNLVAYYKFDGNVYDTMGKINSEWKFNVV
mgnify:CR=1 FL=1